MKAILESCLDRMVRPNIHMGRRRFPAFHVCGCAGLALASLLAMILAAHWDLSPWIMGGVIMNAVLTFLGLALFTKVVSGGEKLVYYHHEIAVMISSLIFVKLLGQPVLPCLDATILGVGLFLACGRAGCLLGGCCHGRPHPWGVCYGEEHADAGFTPCYVGVRLFPVQAVESLWVLSIVLVGAAFVLNGHPPGDALAWYVIAYGAGRFCFEFLRGDAARPHICGFSEAQWTSLLLMGVVVWSELSAALPFHHWHVWATGGLVLIMVAVGLRRRFHHTKKHRLLEPCHVKEIAEVMEQFSHMEPERAAVWKTGSPITVQMGVTSLGVRISMGKIRNGAGWVDHYAFSFQEGPMTREAAGVLADLVLLLRRSTGSTELVRGNKNVFHLMVHPSAQGSRP